MSKAVLLLGLTSVAFAGTAVYFKREVDTGREQQAQLEQRIRALEAGLSAAAGERPATSPSARDGIWVVEPAPAPSTAVPPASAVPNESEPPVPPAFNRRNFQAAMERRQQMLQDPKYRAAMKMQSKAGLLRLYADAGSALGLRPEEADRLLDLLAEQQLQAMEQGQNMRMRAPTDPSSPDALNEWRQLQEQEQQRKDAEIAALLGDTGLQAWKDYQDSLSARTQVRELRTVLDGSTAPLRDDQFQPLVSALAAAERKVAQGTQNAIFTPRDRPPSQAERTRMMEESIERTARINRQLHDAAAPHLSSEQLRRFDRMLEQRLDAARANFTMMQAQQGPGIPAIPGNAYGMAIAQDVLVAQ